MDALKNMVINYFNMGIYTKDDLPVFVSAGWISQADSDYLTKA
ncbi:XkdX family protein [Lacticaseibacillus rhamnosus]|nr:XkdX family protein [Lacticaseibacillus rhamnosus]MDE3295923.1 XkdX family protein [Lacticaseibacillus rhamnosus]